ncbi:uncharacterized protein [Procambarus clarkii]|uniref:uncharacterized protein isoform X2 n=1 Tax=Procambarus clarkii TaxID=6728 RepID=UPI0037433EB6
MSASVAIGFLMPNVKLSRKARLRQISRDQKKKKYIPVVHDELHKSVQDLQHQKKLKEIEEEITRLRAIYDSQNNNPKRRTIMYTGTSSRKSRALGTSSNPFPCSHEVMKPPVSVVDIIPQNINESPGAAAVEVLPENFDAAAELAAEIKKIQESQVKISQWQQRRMKAEISWEESRSVLFEWEVCRHAVPVEDTKCFKCRIEASIKCEDCHRLFCYHCDMKKHFLNPFHDRFSWASGYYEALPPTVTVDLNGTFTDWRMTFICPYLSVKSVDTAFLHMLRCCMMVDTSAHQPGKVTHSSAPNS